ncbi:MAG: hypothetical protein NT069_03500 [Planctomycetota bacterium]|nr:hypothetical protein [Planctomycetota bacterium]
MPASFLVRLHVIGTSWVALGLLTLCVPTVVCADEADPVFDVPALLATPLRPKILKRHVGEGIITEEVQFHSEQDGNQDVLIFAYFSYPEGQKQLPAYIWNPGGLGQASPAYTQAGARRGYATLCIDFPQPGYRSTGGYPINSGLILEGDPRQAPIYHGAVALLKAVSYLESREEVDRDRIGMAGSSWGGFFTTLMVGIDSRLKVGSCLYGTGSLELGNAWWDGNSRNGRTPPTPADRERWRVTLDPAARLARRKTPIAWFTGTNDQFYFLSGVMRTYELAAGPKRLTLVPNWDHALPQRLHDESIFAWLDEHLKGIKTLPTVSALSVQNEGNHLIARWWVADEVESADLIASFGESGNWRGRYWHTFPATIENGECRAELPAATLPCFVSGSVVSKTGLRSSTPLLRVEAKELGITATVAVPSYDGCSLWGGFEEPQIAYLDRHTKGGQTRWNPKLSADAKEGEQSAILPVGDTLLPPILSTATVPHRLTAWLKAAEPVEIALFLGGKEQPFRIGTEWTEIALDHTPAISPLGETTVVLRVPATANVLIDAIRFQPR